MTGWKCRKKYSGRAFYEICALRNAGRSALVAGNDVEN